MLVEFNETNGSEPSSLLAGTDGNLYGVTSYADFAVRLLLSHTLAEVEHLIALSIGALLGRRFITGSWPRRQAEWGR